MRDEGKDTAAVGARPSHTRLREHSTLPPWCRSAVVEKASSLTWSLCETPQRSLLMKRIASGVALTVSLCTLVHAGIPAPREGGGTRRR